MKAKIALATTAFLTVSCGQYVNDSQSASLADGVQL
jgi:hypothetical protein